MTIYGMNVKVASELELAGAVALGKLVLKTDEIAIFEYRSNLYVIENLEAPKINNQVIGVDWGGGDFTAYTLPSGEKVIEHQFSPFSGLCQNCDIHAAHVTVNPRLRYCRGKVKHKHGDVLSNEELMRRIGVREEKEKDDG